MSKIGNGLIYFGGLIGLAVLVGGGWWFWQYKNKPIERQNTDIPSITTSTGQSLLGIQSSSTGGLRVDTGGSATNLGQLTPESSNATNSAPKSSSATNTIDPKTFSQYDRYKNDKGALFGEIKAGTGDALTSGKKAAVYYKGWLTSGELFDQTQTGADGKLKPLVFTLGANQVIPGLEQGIYGMKAGGTRLIIVPPAVGYGEAGQGPVPSNAVLIFQVQLIDVE